MSFDAAATDLYDTSQNNSKNRTEKEKRHEKGEKIVGSGTVSADGV